ncbi:uncharacterized protein LACBIDRAFT_314489 [Laccaria bicolor S238N-H82]|uniref:Predicted protein n=1 Tax=Laccaria bicolor (strain S238N-H82 / ATCC MYA-4686) TaxID=486041 RepID=B0DYN8_LACBS|nr:uncharacterized protein LACBIDRAFT_314489 [Laccaria bicolor S238N-H82]EDR00324.1 predicted protein [Laccaria bicolor S238N-H82]|eukprot:XP_001889076.1 predicted protein [Laccaria bicolor S238N-H82]
MATAVAGIVLSAIGVAKGIGDTGVALFGGEDTLKRKRHWMQCSVKNETQYELVLADSYFDSGEYYDAPHATIPKFSVASFSVCNRTGLAGVSGGNLWTMELDNKTELKFSLGYTDPVVGSRKSGAIVGHKAKDGYEGATQYGTNSKSGEYKGKDDKNTPTYFFFTLTAVTGHHTIYTIRQTVTDTEWQIDV